MKEILTCAMDVGEQMLVSGAEVHRVEDSIKRMCLALGARRIDVFIITSSMVATVYTEDGNGYTQTRRITSTGTDIERLHRLNALSRRICQGSIEASQVSQELEEILKTPVYPFWAELIACAFIAGAFTLFFGGGWLEALASFFIGAVVKGVLYLTEKGLKNKIFCKFVCSFVASSLAFAAVKLHLAVTVDKIIIGNIMSLIPGIGFTNALRDLFTGDNIAGLLRSIEAVLMALAIAAGYFLYVCTFGGL